MVGALALHESTEMLITNMGSAFSGQTLWQGRVEATGYGHLVSGWA